MGGATLPYLRISEFAEAGGEVLGHLVELGAGVGQEESGDLEFIGLLGLGIHRCILSGELPVCVGNDASKVYIPPIA
jgi:hypothetical protein